MMVIYSLSKASEHWHSTNQVHEIKSSLKATVKRQLCNWYIAKGRTSPSEMCAYTLNICVYGLLPVFSPFWCCACRPHSLQAQNQRKIE